MALPAAGGEASSDAGRHGCMSGRTSELLPLWPKKTQPTRKGNATAAGARAPPIVAWCNLFPHVISNARVLGEVVVVGGS